MIAGNSSHEPAPMLPFDPRRRELLDAFCAQPFGPFAPELEPFARWVYYQPGPGRWVVLTLERHRRWQLAWFSGRRGKPFEPVAEATYDSLVEVTAALARRRWQDEIEPRIARP